MNSAVDGKPELVTLTDVQRRARRRRSIALGLALAGFVVVMYVITVIKMGPAILERAM